MKKISLVFMAIMSLLMTSCLGNDEPESTMTLNSSMTDKVSNADGTSNNVYNSTYNYTFDFIAGTVDIVASDVKFADRMPRVSFMLKSVPFTVDSRGYVINVKDAITPIYNGAALSEYKITNLTGRILPYNNLNFISLNYDVNGVYKVTSLGNASYFLFEPKTVITAAEGTPYENTKTTYSFYADAEAGNAQITIYEAKFNEKMPSMTIRLAGLNLTGTVDGILATADKVTPDLVLANGQTGQFTPMPQYAVTDVKVTVVNDVLNVSFVCTITQEGSTVQGASFTVNATAQTFPSQSSDK